MTDMDRTDGAYGVAVNIVDQARAIVLDAIVKATPKPDDSGYLTELWQDIASARPAKMDSWLAMDAVIAALRQSLAREPATADVVRAKYANMDIDERAVAMADDGVGDPWELLGFFREKLRQAEVNAEGAKTAAIGYAQRLAAISRAAPSSGHAMAEGER